MSNGQHTNLESINTLPVVDQSSSHDGHRSLDLGVENNTDLPLRRSLSAARNHDMTAETTPKASDLTVGRSSSLKASKSAMHYGSDLAMKPQITPANTSPQFQASLQHHQPSLSLHDIKIHPNPEKPKAHHAVKSESHVPQLDHNVYELDVDGKLPSAPSSPGLFTPKSSPLRLDGAHSDTSESYSSPFLHFTHQQPPKE